MELASLLGSFGLVMLYLWLVLVRAAASYPFAKVSKLPVTRISPRLGSLRDQKDHFADAGSRGRLIQSDDLRP